MNIVAGDVDPVQISSLLNNDGTSPNKIVIHSQAAISNGNSVHGTGNTPLKGRRKQP